MNSDNCEDTHYKSIEAIVVSMEKYQATTKNQFFTQTFDFDGQKKLWEYLSKNHIRIIQYPDLLKRYEDTVNTEQEREILREEIRELYMKVFKLQPTNNPISDLFQQF